MPPAARTRRLSAANEAFYRAEIAPLLPPAVLDFHAHTWSAANWKVNPWASGRLGSKDIPGGKYMVSQEEYPPRSLLADGQRCFPDRYYQAVAFGIPNPATDWEADTAFLAAAGRRPTVPMAWEIVLAIREAASHAGLIRTQLQGIFHANGWRRLRRVARAAAASRGNTLPVGAPCSAISVWCSVFDVRCSTFRLRCPWFDVRCSMFDV